MHVHGYVYPLCCRQIHMGQTVSFIDSLLARVPEFPQRLHSIISPDRTFEVFRCIADTYAPTLSACHTRGPVLDSLLAAAGQEGLFAEPIPFAGNYLQAGTSAAFLGEPAETSIWSVAHLDIISYLTGIPQAEGYPLTPFCQSRQNPGQRPGVALDLCDPEVPVRVYARGPLMTGHVLPGKIEPQHFFQTDVPDLPLATRICYESEAVWDPNTDMLYGCIDNAACCAALVLACIAVRPYRPNIMVIWADEEEGVVDVGPPAFARGAARLLHRMEPAQLPDLVLVSDIQELSFDEDADLDDAATFGQGAAMEAFASRTRGAVTPPRLLQAMRGLLREMETLDVRVRETGRYLNRSDDAALVMATPNIAFLGCPGAFTHFQETPRASLRDIMHLAKALAIVWMVAQDPAWSSQFM